jgi:broad specificity phosphatase PhoE
MANGWYHHPHRETRMEFEARAIHLADWIRSLLTSQPHLPSQQITSTATAVFVLHGYLLTALLNQILFSKPNACVFIHHNTGMTHLEFLEFKSRAVGCSVKYQNAIPHLLSKGREDLKSGDDLVRDQWIKIFQ